MYIYRGQIRNAKQLDAEVIGILKCKIKVYQLEEISEGDQAKGKVYFEVFFFFTP